MFLRATLSTKRELCDTQSPKSIRNRRASRSRPPVWNATDVSGTLKARNMSLGGFREQDRVFASATLGRSPTRCPSCVSKRTATYSLANQAWALNAEAGSEVNCRERPPHGQGKDLWHLTQAHQECPPLGEGIEPVALHTVNCRERPPHGQGKDLWYCTP